MTQLFGAPWAEILKATPLGTVMGANSSEGSSVVLLGIFLIPALIFIVVRSWRERPRIAWTSLLLLALLLVFLLYVLVPGWDAIASILQIDRIHPVRLRFVFTVLFLLVPVLLIREWDRHPPRLRTQLMIAAACALVATATYFWVWTVIRRESPDVLQYTPHWKYFAALIIVGVFAICVRRFAPLGVALVVVATLMLSWGVNPLYRGANDLSTTATGRAVDTVEEQSPGAWLAVGDPEAMAILMQTVDESYSGVQNYPPKELWDDVDPTGRYEENWNRLAHIHWVAGPGEPRASNPSPDIVELTFDSCSAFAQEHVAHVLTDQVLDQDCLELEQTIPQGRYTMNIYSVVPSP